MAFNRITKFNVVNTGRIVDLAQEISNGSNITIAEHNGIGMCEYRPETSDYTYYATYSLADGQIKAMKLDDKDGEHYVAPGLAHNATGEEEDIPANVAMLGALLPTILSDETARDIYENHPERMEELKTALYTRFCGKGRPNDIPIVKVIEKTEGSLIEGDGMIPKVTLKELQGMFPNNVLYGTDFEVLAPAQEESAPKELNGCYRLGEEDHSMAHIVDFDRQEPVEEALTLAKVAYKSPRMRNFALKGNSGTGKSTAAEQLAAFLGVPYRVFSCSAGLEEINMKGTFTPRISSVSLGNVEEAKSTMPIFKSITLALKAMAEKKTVTYELYKTALIEGLENPGVLEIQEPNTVANPAVLNLLNSITDSCGKGQIQLDDGTIVKRHPDSVVVYTWNPGYAGTMDLSASILDRVNFSIEMKTPTAEVLAARSKKQFPAADAATIDQMAEIVRAAADYIEREDITSGNASQRQLDSWVDAVFNCELGIREAFEGTVMAGCSQDPEDRERVKGIFDSSPLASKKKKRASARVKH